MTPSVSVIIPAYNQERYIRAAVESVLAQTLQPAEVFIIDDGSKDGTSAILTDLAGRIRVVRQVNQGVAVARNTGAALASGDLLAFLDGDDTWLPEKLAKQVARFEAEPDLGLVHCGFEQVDERGVVLSRHTKGREGHIARDMLLFTGASVSAPGSTMLVPRRVFTDIGGFDVDRCLAPSEDYEFCLRVTSRWRIGFVPEVLMQYRQHGSNAHRNLWRMERAMTIAFAKYFAKGSPDRPTTRREAFGNLHRMLAGSYLAARQPWPFLRHTVRSLWLTPGNLSYFVAYPARKREARRLQGDRPETASI